MDQDTKIQLKGGTIAQLAEWVDLAAAASAPYVISSNHKIMGQRVNRRVSTILGWTATVGMSVAAAALVVNFFTG